MSVEECPCVRRARRRWHAAPTATCHLVIVLIALQETGLLRH